MTIKLNDLNKTQTSQLLDLLERVEPIRIKVEKIVLSNIEIKFKLSKLKEK